MIVELISKNGEKKDLEIGTLASRLNEIKGDIKFRGEILRETIHNAIDASANRIDIEVKYINSGRVDILINCYGNKLKPFNSIESIVKSLLEVDISEKKNMTDKIGGKGRGAKILLSAKILTIKSSINGKINSIQINNANKQIEDIDKGDRKKLIVNVLNDNDSTDCCDPQITYNIESIDTNNIKYFEHESIVKYLRFFTILSGIKNNKHIEKDLVVNVNGLINRGNSKDINYITNPNSESLILENAFDKLKKFGLDEGCEFTCIKCSNSEIEYINNSDNNDLLEERLNEDEIKKLKEFFADNECYIFRTKDKLLKREMKISTEDKDSIYNGIRTATEGVMINEVLENLSMLNAYPKGGNLFAQYFGYVCTNSISPTGDRNRIQGDTKFYDFKTDFSHNIMPIINKALNFTDNSGNTYKNGKPELIKSLENRDYNIIQGLWSELYFILQYPNKIDSWVAYQRYENQKKPHDFEFEQYFYEIKSKQTNNNYFRNLIHISSVEQLDDERPGYLRIYYLRNNVDSSMLGMNILDIIKAVSKKLDYNQQDKLFTGIEGYLSIDNFREKYDTLDLSKYTSKLDRFIVEYYIEYKVDGSFPCLRKGILEDLCSELNGEGYLLDLSLVNKKLNISPKRQIYNLENDKLANVNFKNGVKNVTINK